MSKELPSYLKLHIEPSSSAYPLLTDPYDGLGEICRAFAEATGWHLNYSTSADAKEASQATWAMPLSAGGQRQGQARLCLAAPTGIVASNQNSQANAVQHLAAAVGRLLEDLSHTQTIVWQREAELAAGVPVISGTDEARKFAVRLESTLKAGVDAVGGQAAGLYLLDTDTSELKLRSSWGLPFRRLIEPPRRLAKAIADLEALAGHAVVLETQGQTRSWHVPEDFASAVCVPVSTPTVPLGTLWIFGTMERTFSDRELNVIEVVAGRLAAELERQMLLVEGQQGSQIKRQLAAARTMQQNQLPQIAPLIEGWQVAGWAVQAQDLGGAFYDWMFPRQGDAGFDNLQPDPNAVFYEWLTCTPKESAVGGHPHVGTEFREFLAAAPECFAVAAGVAKGDALSAAITAQGIRMALRAHAEYSDQPDRLMARINRGIWSGSAGDHIGMMFLAAVEPETGQVHYATAGYSVAMRLSTGSWQMLDGPQLALGLEPDSVFAAQELKLEPGEALVLFSEKPGDCAADSNHRYSFDPLAAVAMEHLEDTANELADSLRLHLERQADELPMNDLALMVVKRLR